MTANQVDFDQLTTALLGLVSDHSAAEVHGMVTGLLSAGVKVPGAAGPGTLETWLDVRFDQEQATFFAVLFEQASAGLLDPDFNFQPLIPGDHTQVATRAAALGHWCSGFLSGFGLSGRFQTADLSEDLRELLADLGKIASLDDEVSDDEENEVDMVEITEYVRMSALLVFAECADAAVH